MEKSFNSSNTVKTHTDQEDAQQKTNLVHTSVRVPQGIIESLAKQAGYEKSSEFMRMLLITIKEKVGDSQYDVRDLRIPCKSMEVQ